MENSRAGRRRLRALVIVFGLLMFSLAAAYFYRDDLESMVIAPAPVGSPRSKPADVTADELAFYNYVGPRLDDLVAEGRILADMGAQRSRNLVELKVRSDRVTELGDQIDAYLASHPVPARLQPAVDSYQAAMPHVRQGMADAKAGLARFDWNALASGFDLFAEGVTGLADASAQLRTAVSPVSTPSPQSVVAP